MSAAKHWLQDGRIGCNTIQGWLKPLDTSEDQAAVTCQRCRGSIGRHNAKLVKAELRKPVMVDSDPVLLQGRKDG